MSRGTSNKTIEARAKVEGRKEGRKEKEKKKKKSEDHKRASVDCRRRRINGQYIYHFRAIAPRIGRSRCAPLSHPRRPHRPRPAPRRSRRRGKPRRKRETRGPDRVRRFDRCCRYAARVQRVLLVSLSLSFPIYLAIYLRPSFSLFLGVARSRWMLRHVKNVTRDAHTREARNRLARLARRDLRPLRQRHLLRTDAAPAAARPRKNPPRCIAPSSCAGDKQAILRGTSLSKQFKYPNPNI